MTKRARRNHTATFKAKVALSPDVIVANANAATAAPFDDGEHPRSAVHMAADRVVS